MHNPHTFSASRLIVLTLVFCAGDFSRGQQASLLPPYHPAKQVSGTIRIWGHGSRQQDYIGPLVRALEQDFIRHQPDVRFDTALLGNASAIGGLYTGVADIALLDRDISAIELDGYQQVFGYDPVSFTVMTGSVDVTNYSPALAIYVNKNNPLQQLSLTQLDALFDADHRRGPRRIETWGELGISGAWADRPIHLYGYRIASNQSQFFERAVMKGGEKWNCHLKEFEGDGTNSAGAQVMNAVASDEYGIGFAEVQPRATRVKTVALSHDDGSPGLLPTRKNISAGEYPLARTVQMYIHQAPNQSADPKVVEFIRYVLSIDGQAVVARNGAYLPLPETVALTELGKMK